MENQKPRRWYSQALLFLFMLLGVLWPDLGAAIGAVTEEIGLAQAGSFFIGFLLGNTWFLVNRRHPYIYNPYFLPVISISVFLVFWLRREYLVQSVDSLGHIFSLVFALAIGLAAGWFSTKFSAMYNS